MFHCLDVLCVNSYILYQQDFLADVRVTNKKNIVDHKSNERIEGIVGNNFSSYVRDYDFSVLLLNHNKDQAQFSIPDGFGDLHGGSCRHAAVVSSVLPSILQPAANSVV